MKKIILLFVVCLLASACTTKYKKVDGELMRVHLATYKNGHIKYGQGCKYQMVPTGYFTTFAITKDNIITVGSGVEWTHLVEEYNEAKENGLEVTRCVNNKKKRKPTDTFNETGDIRCPVTRTTIYRVEDNDFMEGVKKQIILGGYLEVPAKLGEKILRKQYERVPSICYTKEVIEQAKIQADDNECYGMPLKNRPNGPGQRYDRYKPYPKAKSGKEMLKDKDPEINWKFEFWDDFFTEDGQINPEILEKCKNK